jgi:predicted molibdopterin-dependent oxidoreductase YjgC
MKHLIDPKQAGQAQFHRLQEKNRSAVEFSIDGQIYQALLGDTVLTALLTNQGAIRRTEFSGQKRAGFCLMGACQDCWIWLESGERLRACSTMLESGMRLKTGLTEDLQRE